MAITAEQLNVILSAKDKQFAKAMNDNAKRVERFSKRSQKSLSKTTNSFKKLTGVLGGLAAGLSVGLLVSKTKQAISVLDEIGKTADNLGLTTSALQELRTIAESSGMTFEEFTKGFARFSVAVGEAATGTGEAVQAFKTLGISLTTSSGATRQTEDLFNELADAMSNFENAADRANIMADLFGQKVGVKMLNMLSNGSDGMKRMREEAKALGIVIDEDLIRNAEKAQTQLDLMSRVISANLNSALVELAPTMVKSAGALASLTRMASKFLAIFEGKTILGMADALNKGEPALVDFENRVHKAIQKFKNEDKFVIDLFPSDVTRRFNQRMEVDTLEALKLRVQAAKEISKIEERTFRQLIARDIYRDSSGSIAVIVNQIDEKLVDAQNTLHEMEVALIKRYDETLNRKNVTAAKSEAQMKVDGLNEELAILKQTAKERDLALIQEQKLAIITKIKNEHLRAGVEGMKNPWEGIWDGEKIAEEYEKAALAIHKIKFATFDLAEANKKSAEMYELNMKSYENNIRTLGLSLDEFGLIFLSDVSDAAKTLQSYSQLGKIYKAKDAKTAIEGLNDSLNGLINNGYASFPQDVALEVAQNTKKSAKYVKNFFMNLDRAKLGFMTSQPSTTIRNNINSVFRVGVDLVNRSINEVLHGRNPFKADTGAFVKYMLRPAEARVFREIYKDAFPESGAMLFREMADVSTTVSGDANAKGISGVLSRLGTKLNILNTVSDNYIKQGALITFLRRNISELPKDKKLKIIDIDKETLLAQKLVDTKQYPNTEAAEAFIESLSPNGFKDALKANKIPEFHDFFTILSTGRLKEIPKDVIDEMDQDKYGKNSRELDKTKE